MAELCMPTTWLPSLSMASVCSLVELDSVPVMLLSVACAEPMVLPDTLRRSAGADSGYALRTAIMLIHFDHIG